MTKNPFFYKLTIFILLAGILYSPLFSVFETKKVEAQVSIVAITDPLYWKHAAVMEGAAGTTAGATGATATATSGSFSKKIWEFATKFAGFVFKKVILERLRDAMIQYIQRGYKGGIVQDWGQLLEDAGNEAVGLLAENIKELNFLCSPFNLQVQLALIPLPQFHQQAACTLDQITGNIESFLNDFENGNWIAYQELWYPQNNYFGATIMAWNEAKIKANKAEKAASDQAVAGQGFLSFQKCDANGKNCRTVTPGVLAASAGIEALVKIPANSIINADELATYIGAIADAAINQLIKSGIDGIKSLGKTSEATKATTANPCAGLTGEAYSACKGLTNLINSGTESDKNYLLSQINKTLTPRKEAADYLVSAINNQQELVTALEALAVCDPTDANKQELAVEQGVLDELQNKYEDNQTFVESLQQVYDQINESSDIGNMVALYTANEPLLDPSSAEELLDSAKTQDSEIQTNIDAKLSSAQSRLKAIGCQITTASPTL